MEPSEAMIAAGRALPGGRHPKLRWIRARLEDAPLDPPYALAVAGASFHWMDPDVVLPRLARALTPRSVLAVLDGDGPWRAPWEADERTVMCDVLSRVEGARPRWWRDADEREAAPLVVHRLFEPRGEHWSAPAPFEQSVDDYLRCLHSRQSFAEEHLGPDATRAFDAAMREVLAPHARDGMLRFGVRTRIAWGRPREPDGAAPEQTS